MLDNTDSHLQQFRQIWLSSTQENKLTKQEALKIHIPQSITTLLDDSSASISLREKSVLLSGYAALLKRKILITQKEAENLYNSTIASNLKKKPGDTTIIKSKNPRKKAATEQVMDLQNLTREEIDKTTSSFSENIFSIATPSIKKSGNKNIVQSVPQTPSKSVFSDIGNIEFGASENFMDDMKQMTESMKKTRHSVLEERKRGVEERSALFTPRSKIESLDVSPISKLRRDELSEQLNEPNLDLDISFKADNNFISSDEELLKYAQTNQKKKSQPFKPLVLIDNNINKKIQTKKNIQSMNFRRKDLHELCQEILDFHSLKIPNSIFQINKSDLKFAEKIKFNIDLTIQEKQSKNILDSTIAKDSHSFINDAEIQFQFDEPSIRTESPKFQNNIFLEEEKEESFVKNEVNPNVLSQSNIKFIQFLNNIFDRQSEIKLSNVIKTSGEQAGKVFLEFLTLIQFGKIQMTQKNYFGDITIRRLDLDF